MSEKAVYKIKRVRNSDECDAYGEFTHFRDKKPRAKIQTKKQKAERAKARHKKAETRETFCAPFLKKEPTVSELASFADFLVKE